MAIWGGGLCPVSCKGCGRKHEFVCCCCIFCMYRQQEYPIRTSDPLIKIAGLHSINDGCFASLCFCEIWRNYHSMVQDKHVYRPFCCKRETNARASPALYTNANANQSIPCTVTHLDGCAQRQSKRTCTSANRL